MQQERQLQKLSESMTDNANRLERLQGVMDRADDRHAKFRKAIIEPTRLMTLAVCLLGLSVAGIVLFLVIRLGPEGYSAQDAQRDRDLLCNALMKRFPDDPFLCPEIQGEL